MGRKTLSQVESSAERMLQIREQAELDFFYFAWEVLGYRDVMHPGYHGAMCSFMQQEQEERIKLIMCFRASLKSTICDIAHNLWVLLNDPDRRILIMHALSDKAEELLGAMRAHMERNSILKRIAPDVFFQRPRQQSDLWRKEMLTIKRNLISQVPSVMATGIESEATGFHFTDIKLDDVVYDNNSQTPEARTKIANKCRMITPLLLGEDAKLYYIGTPYHRDDAYRDVRLGAQGTGRLAGKVKSHEVGIYGTPGSLSGPIQFPHIDPEDGKKYKLGFSEKRIENIKAEMGSAFFASQYLLDPLADEMMMFKKSDILRFDFHNMPADREYTYFTAVDPASSENPGADYVVVLTGAWDDKGFLWILDITRGHVGLTASTEWIFDHVKRWNPDGVIIETVAYQQQLKRYVQEQQIARDIYFRVIPMNRGDKVSKTRRIMAIQAVVETHRMYVRDGLDDVVDELSSWAPKGATHDDICDCVADIHSQGKLLGKPKRRDVPRDSRVVEHILQNEYQRRLERISLDRVYVRIG